MPYIKVNTNIRVLNKLELKEKLEEVIQIIPEKTPERAMIRIQDEMDMFYATTGEACAMIETQVNKGTNQSKNQEYCDAMINLISQTLNIPVHRIFATVNELDFWFAKK